MRCHRANNGCWRVDGRRPTLQSKCKNEIGVLFDDKAEEKAFDAAASGPDGDETVPWPPIEADAVKTHDERFDRPAEALLST